MRKPSAVYALGRRRRHTRHDEQSKTDVTEQEQAVLQGLLDAGGVATIRKLLATSTLDPAEFSSTLLQLLSKGLVSEGRLTPRVEKKLTRHREGRLGLVRVTPMGESAINQIENPGQLTRARKGSRRYRFSNR